MAWAAIVQQVVRRPVRRSSAARAEHRHHPVRLPAVDAVQPATARLLRVNASEVLRNAAIIGFPLSLPVALLYGFWSRRVGASSRWRCWSSRRSCSGRRPGTSNSNGSRPRRCPVSPPSGSPADLRIEHPGGVVLGEADMRVIVRSRRRGQQHDLGAGRLQPGRLDERAADARALVLADDRDI